MPPIIQYSMVRFGIVDYSLNLFIYGDLDLWIGASDASQESNWIWDNGGRPMYPGYANWQLEQ